MAGQVTLADVTAVENGAQFHAADLHVHTYGGSHDVKDATMTVQAVIEAAVSSGISILAVTDHNNDANVAPALEYAKRHSGKLLLLPGVEVTTANGHLLVYFPPAAPTNVSDLLGRIGVVGGRGAQTSHTTKSMAEVISEAERLGGICIAAHIDRIQTGFEMMFTGYPNFKKDIIGCAGLYGLEFDDAAHLSWYSPEDEPTDQGGNRKSLLESRRSNPSITARARLAAVQNSDAHDLAGFKAPTAKRTRYKMAALTFEAFRTALVDSEARVRVVASVPRAVPRVVGMQIRGGFLDGETYHFSRNLNCFIGGRGTGKSTALKSLAYGMGVRDDLAKFDNCPDTVVVYCEDESGVHYRFERNRGSGATLRAKQDQSILQVPLDAFRVEYYAQGELADVGKDPLKNPMLLQEFLDRHVQLGDLKAREREIATALEQNSAQLIPLEADAALLPSKEATLVGLDTKLKAAETGKLRELALVQAQLAAERSLRASLGDVRTAYLNGLGLGVLVKDFDALRKTAGDLTDAIASHNTFEEARAVLEQANKFLKEQEAQINVRLKGFAQQIDSILPKLDPVHAQYNEYVSEMIKNLQSQGLSGSVAELNLLVTQRTRLAGEIAAIKGKAAQLQSLRDGRAARLTELLAVRAEMLQRRKSQLKAINDSLGSTIPDYRVFLKYEASGMIESFKSHVLAVMQGTYFQDEMADRLCRALTPQELAAFVLNSDVLGLGGMSGLGQEWAARIVQTFRTFARLHALEIMDKPASPTINVILRGKGGAPDKPIPVAQLSDGQKHTILLVMAMLGDSQIPLIMDQPEDDLDNAFIFSTVVSTLRRIKERRQVILVTHNANIAVLGDSELLLPLRRDGEKGSVDARGSIDKGDTKTAVQNVLEGGQLAFKKRMEIYAH